MDNFIEINLILDEIINSIENTKVINSIVCDIVDNIHINSYKCKYNHKIEDFLSVSFQTKKPFSLRKFQYFLDNQLKSNVFRAKGILWFSESERRHLFHLAGKRISIEDSSWKEDRNNQIVFIGKELDKKEILTQLNSCIDNESQNIKF